MSWYALHLGSLVVDNFSQFIEIMAMPETPQLPLMIVMLALTTYLAASGVETLGKWAIVTLPILCLIVTLTVVMSLSQMDFTNIQPVMGTEFSKIAAGSLKLFTFPLAETVLFLGLAGSIKRQTNPYKLYIYATAFTVLILLVVMVRNIELLGPALMKIEYFPSYIAARIINIGDFLTRIEGSISMNFVIAGVTKITVCLLVAAKGIAHLFGITNYRKILICVSLLMLALSAILYDTAMEMFAFLETYQYYALPFQIVIPVIVWVFAEFKVRRQKKLAAGR
jgi:spore germination protein KB